MLKAALKLDHIEQRACPWIIHSIEHTISTCSNSDVLGSLKNEIGCLYLIKPRVLGNGESDQKHTA